MVSKAKSLVRAWFTTLCAPARHNYHCRSELSRHFGSSGFERGGCETPYPTGKWFGRSDLP